MKTIQEKQLEFLNDTISHFNSTNRGINKTVGNCSYVAGCAIGRHLPKELCERFDSGDYKYTAILNLNIFNQLPDNLKELTIEFLDQIQGLHDREYYWDEKSLTNEGLEKVNIIKAKFSLN